MTQVGVQRLSTELNLTPRRVQQLVPEGLPKAKRGLYDLEASMAWYIRYLQTKLSSGGGAGGEISGKERLDNIKAQREEILLAKDQGEAIALADFEAAMADLITPARQELLALHAKLRPIIGAEHADLVGAEIKRSLRDLSVEACRTSTSKRKKP